MWKPNLKGLTDKVKNVVSKEDSYTFNVKTKEIYISAPETNSGDASFTIVAELTQINLARMFDLSGSGLTTINGS